MKTIMLIFQMGVSYATINTDLFQDVRKYMNDFLLDYLDYKHIKHCCDEFVGIIRESQKLNLRIKQND